MSLLVLKYLRRCRFCIRDHLLFTLWRMDLNENTMANNKRKKKQKRSKRCGLNCRAYETPRSIINKCILPCIYHTKKYSTCWILCSVYYVYCIVYIIILYIPCFVYTTSTTQSVFICICFILNKYYLTRISVYICIMYIYYIIIPSIYLRIMFKKISDIRLYSRIKTCE